jgi:glutamate racemase
MNSRPIGAFDSGIGGLTVVKEIMELLPNEGLIYLGDTARVPYGNKSRETVIRYSRECASFLLEKGIKLLVAACNTASALSLEVLAEEVGVPVVGVVEPGAKAALEATQSGIIGVIGTPSTISSGVYLRAIAGRRPEVKVISRACPLFVPLAEEGWTDNEVARLTSATYLGDLKEQGIDTLVLGCTHYPLLKGVIARELGDNITLVDSARATAQEVKGLLDSNGLLSQRASPDQHLFFLTDVSSMFIEVGKNFLTHPLGRVEKAELSPKVFREQG